jgi:3-oxoadipate enol-lactonase
MPFVTLDRVRLYYERAGRGERLLFISGTGGDLRVKPNVFESPVGAAFDLLAYDQRGLGRSDKPTGPYSMQDYADDAAALLDAIDWPDARVIGVSFGGMVAQELALRHPDRISKLVLACTSPGGAGGASFPLHEIAGLPFDERFRRQIAVSDLRQTPEWQREHAETVAKMFEFNRNAAHIGADDPLKAIGAELQLDARRRHDTWERLHRLDMPVLLAAGRYDGIAPLSNMEGMAQRIRNAELRVYDGGHLFFIQDRGAYPDIVRWLNQ